MRARGHYDKAAGSRRSQLVQKQVGQVEVRQVVGRKRRLVAVDGGLLWRRENARVQNEHVERPKLAWGWAKLNHFGAYHPLERNSLAVA